MEWKVVMAILGVLILVISSTLNAMGISFNLLFKDVIISDGIYALKENNTLIRLDENIKPVWKVQIKGISFERLSSSDNGVLLLDEVLAKVDNNGKVVWAKNISVDDAIGLPNGHVAFLKDNIVGLINPDGNLLWARKFIANGTKLKLLGPLNGTILVVGTIRLNDDPKSHLLLGALSLNGTLLWVKIVNTGYYDRPDVVNGEGIVAGVYGGGSDAPWLADYFALKVSQGGKIKWFNSYHCPGESDWDAFWIMKIRRAFCNGGICTFSTTTGTFIINPEGDPLTYLNVSEKAIGIIKGSLIVQSNGTIITIPLKQNEETTKCYAIRINFKEEPLEMKLFPVKLKVPTVNLSIEGEPKKTHYTIILTAIILVMITIILRKMQE
ncbi:hypothetical protein [Pyrococcus sp. NA2]|uniref:hypothetical protein n=1 Tax=Pyrococcus sp. (strain NA2) TaxID=342949 RepID=UPI000B034C8D|nr:hypothetical protein [Pyrococcus sp. NA2]